MSADYILLPRINIHNANALSGPFTVGFPAVTAWMGFIHALGRKLSDVGFPFIRLSYTGIVCHSFNLQVYKSPEDITYLITGKGKPLNRNGRKASFIEEARCHLNVSLFIYCNHQNMDKSRLQDVVYDLLLTMKIAGGDILSVSAPVIGTLSDDNRDNNRLLRKMMPGYALLERRDLMSDAMDRGEDAMDALLNYIAVTQEYVGEKNSKGKKRVKWHNRRKAPGWIIPVVTGFQGISAPGNAENQRAEGVIHRFAESVVTLGEFRRVDKLRHPADMWWEYSYQKEKTFICVSRFVLIFRARRTLMDEHRDVVSVLSFEKKLVPSDGVFYGTNWQEESPVIPLKLQEKSIRGTLSFRQKKRSESQLPEAGGYMGKPNLQTVDTCALGPELDSLLFRFTLKVIGGLQYPSACNNAAFRQRYEKVAADYLAREKCREQGHRYALNIANARFLWRNRVGAEHIEVVVNILNKGREQQWLFDACRYSIRDFDQRDADISTLGEKIAQALSGNKGALLLEISARVQLGRGQTVYPSGELILNKGKGTKSKVLYHIDGTAAMHSQKIGNALRSVDTWYPAYSDPLNSAGAIAVELFGAVTHLGMVFRPPGSGQDFYTLFYKWVYGELLQENEEHYVVAVLIRGGVFGEGDK